MVRAIVAEDKNRIFYGTRPAFYGVDLTDEKVNSFADDLETTLIKINNLGKPRSDMLLGLKCGGRIAGYKIEIGTEELRLKEDLREALREPHNIQIISEPYEKMIVNLIARFSGGATEKDRGINIYPFGIPNDIFWFDPTPFYELGKKWGKLETGKDFDVTLKNYKEINNRR